MANLVRFLVLLVLSVTLSEVTAVDDCPQPWVQVGSSCQQLIIKTRDRPLVTWQQARQHCQNLEEGKADLAVIPDSPSMTQFSHYVSTTFPEETAIGLKYLIGGQKIINQNPVFWRWVNGSELEVITDMWMPGQPSLDNKEAYTMIVPGKSYGHFYLSEDSSAHGFVCQLS